MTDAAATQTPTMRRRSLARSLAFLDALVLGAASAAAYAVRVQLAEVGVASGFASEVPAALAVLPLWLTILYLLGAYRPEVINSGGDAVRRFSAGTVAGVVALGFTSFLFNLAVSRLYVVLLFGFAYFFGGMVRIAVRARIRREVTSGRLRTNVVIVGRGADSDQIVDAIESSEISGYRVLARVDLESPGQWPTPGEDGFMDRLVADGVGLVIVSPTEVSPGVLRELFLVLEGTSIDLAVAPSPFAVTARRLTVETVGNVPLLHLDQVRLERGRAAVKRTLDLVVAGVLILLTWPLMLLAAVAIRVDSRGPVLFRQERAGKDGKPFQVLKFRTMVVDAEEQRQDLEHLNEVGHGFFKIREDPRVTRVGRVLRKWSVDELPQLGNVLTGDMSMVGPRPPTLDEVEHYEPWQMRRLRIRPGITGVWQTSGRSEIPFAEAIRMDLFYIENWSIGYDLFLLAKTVAAVLGRGGAY